MTDNNITLIVRTWLPLLILTVSCAIAWGVQRTVISEHERRIQQLEIEVNQNDKILSNINEMYSRIDERTLSINKEVEKNSRLLLDLLRMSRNNSEYEK